MKCKDYKKPTMQVVKLQHLTLLQQASGNEIKATMCETFEEEDI